MVRTVETNSPAQANVGQTVKVETPDRLVEELLFLLGLEGRKPATLYMYQDRGGVYISRAPVEGIRKIIFRNPGGRSS
jgi:hypothetical protein